MIKIISGLTALLLATLAQGAPLSPSAPEPGLPPAPVLQSTLSFARIAPPPGTFALRGTRPQGQIEFGVRSDEVVTKAVLNLSYRPSPALIPTLSQLKIYLNDQLAGLVTLTAEQLGKENQTQVAIDPRFIGDFNRIRFELVGHYTNICENPANSAIWLDIGKESGLDLTLQKLPLKNDLSHFPEPFFDPRDSAPLSLPIVFAATPDPDQQRAAAMLASWFGSKVQWRGQNYPVLIDQLPEQQHAVVFATNAQRPAFLASHPAVSGPTVEMVGQPGSPYQKMLLILGRDDRDLITAVQGIAQGELLLRGQSSRVESVKTLADRQPYDAPNWVRTDRATTFAELQQYAGQLQSDGLQPAPLNFTLNLPPDLFLIRARGIDMDLQYRYTSPLQEDGSRLAVHLNEQFVQDYPLGVKQDRSSQLLRIPLLQGLHDGNTSLTIPALRLDVVNQLRFDFDYALTFIGGTSDRCETVVPVNNHVVIDGSSTIDFSGYRHFIAMPSLRAFANAGFPFSRYADLAQTVVLMEPQPAPARVTALLNALGTIGAQSGYPALKVQIVDNPAQLPQYDADILTIGTLPPALKDDSKISLLLQATESRISKPLRQPLLNDVTGPASDRQAESQTTIASSGPMAAVIGFQSPFNPQRSVVALLADSPRGWQLLAEAMNDSGKRAAIFGSATIIRESGVSSLRVGDTYYVGHLPWWERLWNALAHHPLWLALLAGVVVLLFAVLAWRLMRAVSRRRLGIEDDDE